MKDNYYQELVDLKRNEDYERKSMGREIQDVLEKHKLERKEFLKKKKKELEEFNGDDQEVFGRIKNGREEMALLEDTFEEEIKEIFQRNEPRRNAIQKIRLRRKQIEERLLWLLL